MKTAVVAIAFAAGIVTAQLEDVPSCAIPCISKYISGDELADCNSLDIACICRNEEFLGGIACCLENTCDEKGKDSAVAYARQICSTQNVDVPDEVVCKDPSSSSTHTSSAAESTEATSGTPTETDGSETTNSPTSTADESDATNSDPPGAAHKALTPVGGILGAVVAVMFAL